jgi:hypothetical protein
MKFDTFGNEQTLLKNQEFPGYLELVLSHEQVNMTKNQLKGQLTIPVNTKKLLQHKTRQVLFFSHL